MGTLSAHAGVCVQFKEDVLKCIAARDNRGCYNTAGARKLGHRFNKVSSLG